MQSSSCRAVKTGKKRTRHNDQRRCKIRVIKRRTKYKQFENMPIITKLNGFHITAQLVEMVQIRTNKNNIRPNKLLHWSVQHYTSSAITLQRKIQLVASWYMQPAKMPLFYLTWRCSKVQIIWKNHLFASQQMLMIIIPDLLCAGGSSTSCLRI